MLFTEMSHADFTFHSSAPNACEDITGNWNGKGTGSNWLIGSCVYHGIGTISALDSTGHFTLALDIEKDSGSFLCPNHATSQLSGTCINGVVTINTGYGNLTGNFSNNAGNANGTLSALGMSIDVTAQFLRIK